MDGTILNKKYNLVGRIEALEEGSEIPDNVIVEDDVAYQFSTTSSYFAGSFVYKDHTLYRFDVDHDAGAWNTEEVTAVRICDSIVSEFGDGLHRTGNEVYVKLQVGGGLAFDGNGALYTNVLHNYSTNEQSTGLNWIDGKPIYFRVFSGLSVQMGTTWTDTNIDISSIETIVDGKAIDDAGQLIDSSFGGTSDDSLLIRAPFSGNTIASIVLYYTKNAASKKKTNK